MGLLNWTGNALADVGIAALCAMVRRRRPEDLTLEDLDQAAEEMRAAYFDGAWISYLTCVFPNAEYVQPGTADKKAASRKAYTERVLFAHRATPTAEAAGKRCFLSGLPATQIIHRVQMPLITGESVLNFFPDGLGGFPIAGPYLTALQALPFGGRRAEGRLLIVHADSPQLTLEFALRYVTDNRRLISMAGQAMEWDGPRRELPREQAKKEKMPQVRWPQTLVIRDLMRAMRDLGGPAEAGAADFLTGSVCAYWLSNSGQGASIDLFEVPANLVRLLMRLTAPANDAGWNTLLRRGWLRQKARSAKNPDVELPARAGRSRNAVLEDLLHVYQGGTLDPRHASRFVRRHLIGIVYRRDTTFRMPDWPLITLFMEELFGMSPKRIGQIKDFAEQVMSSIVRSGRKKLVLELSRARRPWEFRGILLKELRRDFAGHGSLLFTLEQYLDLFEDEDGAGLSNWGLTRDLIIMRLFQLSHERNLELREYAPELDAEDKDVEELTGAEPDDEAA